MNFFNCLLTGILAHTAPVFAPSVAPPHLVTHDGQRLSGELHVASLRVPEGTSVIAERGLTIVSSSFIEIHGAIRSQPDLNLGTADSGDIRITAAETIAIAKSGLIVAARGDDASASEVSGERGSHITLQAPLTWIDGTVRAGDGGIALSGGIGGTGGDVFVFGRALTNRDVVLEGYADGPVDFGIFGGNGGFGGGNGGSAMVFDTGESTSDWLRHLEQLPSARRAIRPGRSFEPDDGDQDPAPCPNGATGADGAPATGGWGANGLPGADAPWASGANGEDGQPGGGGGGATGGTGAGGGNGSDCCPNAGGAGGGGGKGGKGEGGRGGRGGKGGNGSGLGQGGVGGTGGDGGSGTGGTGGTGGNGGRATGAKGAGGAAGPSVSGGRGPGGAGGKNGIIGSAANGADGALGPNPPGNPGTDGNPGGGC